MKQLVVFCEGPTEQVFCAQVLRPHLFPSWEGKILTLGVGDRGSQPVFGIGSRKRYSGIRSFILKTIKQRQGPHVYFTTLFDLYALSNDFPGRSQNTLNPAAPEVYARTLEQAFAQDVDHFHFIPHLQLYEFEAMLFAGPDGFQIAFEHCEERIQTLRDIALSYTTPELINDGSETAPSKRIVAVFPQYRGRKTTAGPDIAEFIGVGRIRERCPHFHQWLERLEGLEWPEDAPAGN